MDINGNTQNKPNANKKGIEQKAVNSLINLKIDNNKIDQLKNKFNIGA